MIGWLNFCAALAVFFLSHFLPSRGGLRQSLIGLLGRRAYFAAYGIVSIFVLVWLVVAAAQAPYVEVWPQAPWQRWVPNIVMPVALFFIVAGIDQTYPHTLGGGRRRPFDPLDPGFAAVTRHPLIWALALWSAAHLFPNGDLAHVILFGGFCGLSVAAFGILDRRGRRAMTPEDGQIAFRATSLLSLRPLLSPAWREANEPVLVVRLAFSLIIWALILWWHQPLIGVSPLPV